MIDFYNAFISYKHGPVDNKVAAHIQSQLEHFHIPGKIRKKTGKKRIQRIFRDKEELPITSNLNDTIEDALQKSEYLIVICSPNTKESVWVKREIEFFLKTHTRDHILTVISEGEPQDVLLPELLEEEVSILQPDGTTRTVLREKEPLCCDYRMSFRKADKEELPRLASALIGCSYDELMNRRRAYQMQRITILGLILTALTLGFSGYVIRSNMKLKKSYDDTLRNQSIYLANESKKLLESEQRIEAIQLALAALPSEGNDRPVTAEAIRALTDATLAYVPISGNSIHSVWTYAASSTIRDIQLSPDHSSLAARDASNTVTVWEAESHDVLMEKSYGNQSVYAISYIGDDELLIVTSHDLELYDVFSGKTLWTQTLRDDSFRMMQPLVPEEAESFFIVTQDRNLLRISSLDGEILENLPLPKDAGNYAYTVLDDYSLSPDGNRIAFSLTDDVNYHIYVINLSDGSTQSLPISLPDVRDIGWIDNDTVVACIYDYYSTTNNMFSEVRLMAPCYTEICCLDFARNEERWTAEFVFNDKIKQSGFLALPAKNAVAYFCGNLIKVFDAETGETLHDYDVNVSVVHLSDTEGDGTPLFITANGGLGSPIEALGRDACSISNEFADDIFEALVGSGVYILRERSNYVLYYNVHVSDVDWTEMDKDLVMHQIREDYYLDEEYLVVDALDGSSPCVSAFDAGAQKLLWTILLDEDIGSLYEILGVFDDELYILTRPIYNEDHLLRIDMQDGEILEDTKISEFTDKVNLVCSLSDGYLTYIYKDEKAGGYRLRGVDLNTGDEEKFVLPIDVFSPNFAPCYYGEAEAIYYSDSKEGDYITSFQQGKQTINGDYFRHLLPIPTNSHF